MVHRNVEAPGLFNNAGSECGVIDILRADDAAAKNKALLTLDKNGLNKKLKNTQLASRFKSTMLNTEKLC